MRSRSTCFTIDELQQETVRQVESIWLENPGKRIRLKHVGGGGGRGQRVVTSVEEIAEAVMSVLIESNAAGEGDNKNFLIELNIENTRHNEIQLLGNGKVVYRNLADVIVLCKCMSKNYSKFL